MKTLAKVWNETTVTQTVLAVLIWAAIIYLIAVGQPVPELLLSAGMVVLGYFFGTTNQVLTNRSK